MFQRERSVQTMEAYLKVMTSIPGIDAHDANAVLKFNNILHYQLPFFSPRCNLFPKTHAHTSDTLNYIYEDINGHYIFKRPRKKYIQSE